MLSVCLLILVYNSVFCDVIVNTNKGNIIGQISEDGSYSTFFGMPYALVDVTNPFGNSLEYPNFSTPFNASDQSIQCPQLQSPALREGGRLQCLTLDIYVPKTANSSNTVPVFVWIYGGGFFAGSAGLYDGKYLVQHDIIVVAINYRLGPYGFLCLDDPAVPGNQGLKDQITALRWIKENIAAFGGDNKKITVAGESYGGGSVDLHMFSKYETLFNKAIIQSGGAEVRALYYKPDYQAAVKLAAHFGYNTTKNQEALPFLAKVNPIELTKAAVNLSIILRVCPEKKFKGVQNFLTDDPFHLSNPERIRKTDILIGYTSKEDFGSFVNKTDDFYTNLSSIFYDRLKEVFDFKEDELQNLAKIVQTFYMGNKTFSKDAMLELVDFSSDSLLNRAAESSVNRFIRQGAKKVYKYLFSYVGGSPYKDVPGVGAYHTEELQYLFDWFNASEKFTDEQILMRDRMTKMWSNFVKYGNPTPEVTTLLPVPWIPVTNDVSRPYMNIDITMNMLDHVYHNRIAFWDLFWHSYWRKARVAVKRKHH